MKNYVKKKNNIFPKEKIYSTEWGLSNRKSLPKKFIQTAIKKTSNQFFYFPKISFNKFFQK